MAGQAGVASNRGAASVEGGLQATLRAELNRGTAIKLSLSALASIDAAFSKFISAEVDGEARTEVGITGQVQLPSTLADEIGAAVRLRIAAEAAAGVSLALGLRVGDFVALIEADEHGGGLPARLMRVLLEEGRQQYRRGHLRQCRGLGHGPRFEKP